MVARDGPGEKLSMPAIGRNLSGAGGQDHSILYDVNPEVLVRDVFTVPMFLLQGNPGLHFRNYGRGVHSSSTQVCTVLLGEKHSGGSGS